MVVFNYSTRELTTKVVYYGPGLCGKTTNLQFIYDHMPQGVRGKMLSLATKSDRTLFFDFLPIDLGQIQGMKTKVQLYTVPGQVFYNETRRLVLKGADGVVFVADSQENMIEANLDSLRNLEDNLQAHGMSLADTPHVLQFNKQDLPNALPVDTLNERLNRHNAPFYEAIATTGVGVQETLRHITKLVLLKLNEKYGKERSPGAARTATTVAAPAATQHTAPPAAAASSAARAAVELPDVAAMPTLAAPVAASPTVASSSRTQATAASQSHAVSPATAIASPTAVAQPSPAMARTSINGPSTNAQPLVLETPVLAQMPSGSGDDDVLGVRAANATRRAPSAGATVKLDRGAYPVIEPAASSQPIGARATATAVAVDASDPLFHEAGVEATVLRADEPHEILIPLELHAPHGVERYRLTLRLELTR